MNISNPIWSDKAFKGTVVNQTFHSKTTVLNNTNLLTYTLYNIQKYINKQTDIYSNNMFKL